MSSNYRKWVSPFGILGSKLIRSSPRLIAAYHVLHRLSVPRHPPDALTTLDRSHDRCSPLAEGAPWVQGISIDRKDQLASRLIQDCAASTSHNGDRPMSQKSSGTKPDQSSLHDVTQQAGPSEDPAISNLFSRTHQKQLTKPLVEPVGIEPTTSCLQSTRSPAELWPHQSMVGLGGLEPPTSRLSSARSNQLSYKPETPFGLKHQPRRSSVKKEKRRRRNPAK